LLKVFRDEKKEEVEAEEAIQELSSKSNKKQPDSKKQAVLGEENFCSSVVGNDKSQFPEDFHRR